MITRDIFTNTQTLDNAQRLDVWEQKQDSPPQEQPQGVQFATSVILNALGFVLLMGAVMGAVYSLGRW